MLSKKKEYTIFFLNSMNLNRLTVDEADVTTRPITEEEIKKRVLKLRNKCSGVIDFLEKILELTQILYRVNDYIPIEGNLLNSWSESVISVLNKENKDPSLCTSYHPISLCKDFKNPDLVRENTIENIFENLERDQMGFINIRLGN